MRPAAESALEIAEVRERSCGCSVFEQGMGATERTALRLEDRRVESATAAGAAIAWRDVLDSDDATLRGMPAV